MQLKMLKNNLQNFTKGEETSLKPPNELVIGVSVRCRYLESQVTFSQHRVLLARSSCFHAPLKAS